MGKTTQTLIKDNDEEIIFRSRYTSVPIPENITLPEFVLKDVRLYADNVAFVDATTKRSYTYGEVVRDATRFSKALRSLGLRTGHVVVVILPNVIEYAIVALGIMAAGSVFSGADPSTHSSVIVVGEERVQGTIFWDELLEAAERASNIGIENTVTQSDLCALPFSSGTTGLSKGVMLTHRNIVANLCSTLFSVGPAY